MSVVDIFVAKPYGPTFGVMIEQLKAEGHAVHELSSIREAMGKILERGQGLLLFHCYSVPSMTAQIGVLQALRALIRQGTLRVMVTTTVNQPRVLDEFEKAGCHDIAIEPVTEKALNQKIQRNISLLKQKFAVGGAPLPEINPAMPMPPASAVGAPAVAKISFTEPLSLSSDCWLMKGGGARRVSGRWLVLLRGPSPTEGKWIEHIQNGADSKWHWEPAHAEGTWVYQGHKPDYRDGFWSFVGKSPELGFYKGEECLGKKLTLDPNGTLMLARDSKAALELLPKILGALQDREVVKIEKTAQPRGGVGAAITHIPRAKESATMQGAEGKTIRFDGEGPEETETHTILAENKTRAIPKYAIEGESVFIADKEKILALEKEKAAKGPIFFTDRVRGRLMKAIQSGETGSLEFPSEGFNEAAALAAEMSPVLEVVDPSAIQTTPTGIALEFRAPLPPGPVIGPLALHFLMSELVIRFRKETKKIAQRFCQYVSASCGGLRAEIWHKDGEIWRCLGSSDDTPPEYLEILKEIKTLKPEHPPYRKGESVILQGTFQGSDLAGAILLSGAGAHLVQDSHIIELGKVMRGLVA